MKKSEMTFWRRTLTGTAHLVPEDDGMYRLARCGTSVCLSEWSLVTRSARSCKRCLQLAEPGLWRQASKKAVKGEA